MNPRIVKVDGPAALLNLVPRLVGFRPAESLVLVAFAGKRSGSAMRFDLPATADPERLDALAGHLVGMLCRVEGVDGFVPVVYTDAGYEDAAVEVVAFLAVHAKSAGLQVKDALCVASDGWGRIPGGERRSLAELRTDEHELVDPAAEVRLPEVSDAARAAFDGLLTAWRTRSAGPGGRIHGFEPAAGLRGAAFGIGAVPFVDRAEIGLDTARLLEGMLTDHEGRHPDDPCPCLAALAAFAEVPALADHLLVHLAWGRRLGERARRAWLERDEDDALASAALGGGEVDRPSVPRIEAALRAIRLALAHLQPADRAPLLGCAAWLEWALGRGSIAGAFVDLALAADPSDTFAAWLGIRLQRGELPEWAFRASPGLSLEAQLRRIA